MITIAHQWAVLVLAMKGTGHPLSDCCHAATQRIASDDALKGVEDVQSGNNGMRTRSGVQSAHSVDPWGWVNVLQINNLTSCTHQDSNLEPTD
jgi:hypothetical protein